MAQYDQVALATYDDSRGSYIVPPPGDGCGGGCRCDVCWLGIPCPLPWCVAEIVEVTSDIAEPLAVERQKLRLTQLETTRRALSGRLAAITVDDARVDGGGAAPAAEVKIAYVRPCDSVQALDHDAVTSTLTQGFSATFTTLDAPQVGQTKKGLSSATVAGISVGVGVSLLLVAAVAAVAVVHRKNKLRLARLAERHGAQHERRQSMAASGTAASGSRRASRRLSAYTTTSGV